MMFTDTQRREIFHFCFLGRLLKISSPSLYVLKGGVNLRFFFNSPRYSEDMDLDVTGGATTTLKKNGYKILSDGAFIRSLRTFGIEDIDINDPEKAKHTGTTQRFRLGLLTSSGLRLPTKVEFSRREDKAPPSAMEMVNPDIARQYRQRSFRCQHYPGHVAAMQKIHALAGRPATQARDVFDLFMLYSGGYVDTPASAVPEEVRNAAIEATLTLGFDDFRGQVLEYLDEDGRHEFAGKASWSAMQETILELLENA